MSISVVRVCPLCLYILTRRCEQVSVFAVCVHMGKVCDTPIPACMAVCACVS